MEDLPLGRSGQSLRPSELVDIILDAGVTAGGAVLGAPRKRY
jgi:hypothetical protein